MRIFVNCLPVMLKSARVSEDSSIGERKGRRFLLRKRENEKALAVTVRVNRAPVSLVAVRKSETTVMVTLTLFHTVK